MADLVRSDPQHTPDMLDAIWLSHAMSDAGCRLQTIRLRWGSVMAERVYWVHAFRWRYRQGSAQDWDAFDFAPDSAKTLIIAEWVIHARDRMESGVGDGDPFVESMKAFFRAVRGGSMRLRMQAWALIRVHDWMAGAAALDGRRRSEAIQWPRPGAGRCFVRIPPT